MEHNYLQDFFNMARQDLQNIAFNDTNLILIRNSIDQWLKKKQELDANIKHRYEMALRNKDLRNIIQADGEADLSRKGMNILIKKYIKGRDQVEELTSREDIVQLFRNGYELIHRIRESFVGREITYRILYQKQGKLLEAHLTLEELLPAISLRWEDQTNAATKQELTSAGVLFVTNSKIKKIMANLKNNQNLLEDYNVEISGDKKDLWDSMVEVRNKMITDNTLNKYSSNFGRLYEVFNLLTRTQEYRTIDTIHKPPKKNTESLFIARLNDVARDHIPGWQGGDLGWDQLKSVFNSSAGLIGNSSIEKTLRDLQTALLKDHKNEMAQALKQIFATPEGTVFNTTVDKLAWEEAIAAIDSRINNLKNID